MTTRPGPKKRKPTEALKTVYQFLYGAMPSAVAPVAIDSSAADAVDPFFQQARSATPWAPLGPIVLPETGDDGRIHPIPKLMWVRSLEVPAGQMQTSAPIAPSAIPKTSPLISLPPGTRVEDVVRGAR